MKGIVYVELGENEIYGNISLYIYKYKNHIFFWINLYRPDISEFHVFHFKLTSTRKIYNKIIISIKFIIKHICSQYLFQKYKYKITIETGKNDYDYFSNGIPKENTLLFTKRNIDLLETPLHINKILIPSKYYYKGLCTSKMVIMKIPKRLFFIHGCNSL